MKQFPWEEKCMWGAEWRDQVKEGEFVPVFCALFLKALSLLEMDSPIFPAEKGMCICFSDDKVQVSSLNRVC